MDVDGLSSQVKWSGDELRRILDKRAVRMGFFERKPDNFQKSYLKLGYVSDTFKPDVNPEFFQGVDLLDLISLFPDDPNTLFSGGLACPDGCAILTSDNISFDYIQISKDSGYNFLGTNPFQKIRFNGLEDYFNIWPREVMTGKELRETLSGLRRNFRIDYLICKPAGIMASELSFGIKNADDNTYLEEFPIHSSRKIRKNLLEVGDPQALIPDNPLQIKEMNRYNRHVNRIVLSDSQSTFHFFRLFKNFYVYDGYRLGG